MYYLPKYRPVRVLIIVEIDLRGYKPTPLFRPLELVLKRGLIPEYLRYILYTGENDEKNEWSLIHCTAELEPIDTTKTI